MDLANSPRLNSKLENFCRRSPEINYNQLRCYESCVITNAKGSFELSNALLTTDALLITQSPPSEITHKIPLGSIRDVNLIADREAIVRGGGPNNNSYICQHVQIIYESVATSNSKYKQRSRSSNTPTSVDSQYSSNTLDSRASSALDGFILNDEGNLLSHLPIAIQLAYDPSHHGNSSTTSSGYSTSVKIPESNSEEEADKTSLVTTNLTNFQGHQDLPSTYPFRSPSVIEQLVPKWRKGKSETKVQSEGGRRSSLSDITSGFKMKTISNWKKALMKKLSSSSSNKAHADKDLNFDLPRLQKVELHVYFYQRGSIFLNAFYLRWQRQFLRSHNEISYLSSPGPKQNSSTSSNLYEAEDLFHRILNNEIGEVGTLFIKNQTTKKISSKYVCQMLPMLNLFYQALTKYEYLAHFSLKSSSLLPNLERIAKSSIVRGSGDRYVVGDCISKRSNEKAEHLQEFTTTINYCRGGSNNKYMASFMAKVSCHALAMEIFRLLLQQIPLATPGSIMNSLQLNGQPVNSKLSKHEINPRTCLGSDMSEPSKDFGYMVQLVLECIFKIPCFTKYNYNSKLITLNVHVVENADDLLNHDRLVQMLSIDHNISTAILYDILVMANFNSNKEVGAFISSLLQSFDLAPYIRQSMCQILFLLCSSQDLLTISQSTLLHRQLIVLKHMTKYSSFTSNFLKDSYDEEFRYFINQRNMRNKVPEHYSMKEKVEEVCASLHDIIDHDA